MTKLFPQLLVSLLPFIFTPAFATPTEPLILFLGDSLTEGYGINAAVSYPHLLDKALKAKGYKFKIVNAGESGSTSASAEGRLRWQLKNKPDILFLALGANDGLRGLDPSAMKNNLNKTIELAKKEKILVVLAGMMMPMNYGSDYRTKYDAVFKDLAKKQNLIFYPFLLNGVATVKNLNIADGIHPNEKGHEVMAKNLQPLFEKILKDFPKKTSQ